MQVKPGSPVELKFTSLVLSRHIAYYSFVTRHPLKFHASFSCQLLSIDRNLCDDSLPRSNCGESFVFRAVDFLAKSCAHTVDVSFIVLIRKENWMASFVHKSDPLLRCKKVVEMQTISVP